MELLKEYINAVIQMQPLPESAKAEFLSLVAGQPSGSEQAAPPKPATATCAAAAGKIAGQAVKPLCEGYENLRTTAELHSWASKYHAATAQVDIKTQTTQFGPFKTAINKLIAGMKAASIEMKKAIKSRTDANANSRRDADSPAKAKGKGKAKRKADPHLCRAYG